MLECMENVFSIQFQVTMMNILSHFFCQKVPYGKKLILEIYASKYNINSCIYWSQLSSFLMIT